MLTTGLSESLNAVSQFVSNGSIPIAAVIAGGLIVFLILGKAVKKVIRIAVIIALVIAIIVVLMHHPEIAARISGIF